MKKIILMLLLFFTIQIIDAQAEAFISSWITSKDNETLKLDAQADAPSYTIDWGDGFSNTYSETQIPTHTFSNSGEHTISFSGTFPHLLFNNQTNLKAVRQWGSQKWTSMAKMFKDCSTLNDFPIQAPDLSICTDMSFMFSGAIAFNQPLETWNVSHVTNMSGMFLFASAFNQPIGNWNVSSVTNMSFMFCSDGEVIFNQEIGNWDTSSVTNMSYMFINDAAFNQSIGLWNTSKVTNMSGMFIGNTMFDQSLGNWDVSNVTDMDTMFSTKISTINYDATLIGWSKKAKGGSLLQKGVTFSAGNSNYCKSSADRNYIINTYGWTINDAGENCTDLGTDSFNTIKLILYPNPASKVINIKGDSVLNKPYMIVDSLGQIVLEGKLNKSNMLVNIEGLTKGIYFIKVANTCNSFIKE